MRRASKAWPCLCLDAKIDAHGAAEQIYDTNIATSEASHGLCHAALRRIMFERLEDVAVRRSIAAKPFSENWHHAAKIGEVERAPHDIVRLAKIEHKQSPAGFGHAVHLPQASFPTREISQAVTNRHDIK